MEKLLQLQQTLGWLLPIIILWDGVWKSIAMWKSARKNQLVWFIFIAVINSVGILPIVYLLIHRKRATA